MKMFSVAQLGLEKSENVSGLLLNPKQLPLSFLGGIISDFFPTNSEML